MTTASTNPVAESDTDLDLMVLEDLDFTVECDYSAADPTEPEHAATHVVTYSCGCHHLFCAPHSREIERQLNRLNANYDAGISPLFASCLLCETDHIRLVSIDPIEAGE